jgi:O-antigen/teichoic acid export membrane protein
MSLSGKIAKGISFLFSSSVILNLMAFFTSVMVIRALDKEDYGLVTLALSTHAVGNMLLDLALSNLIASEIAHSRGEKRLDKVKRFLMRFGQLELIMAFLLLSVLSLASVVLHSTLYASFSFLLPFVGIYLFLTGVRCLFTTTFYGYGLYEYMALSDISFAFGRFLFVLVFVVKLELGAVGAMITYPLSMALSVLLLFPFWWKVVTPLFSVEASVEPVFRQLLKEQGVYRALVTGSKRIRGQIPVWAIGLLLGTAAVSTYEVGLKGLRFFRSFLTSFQATLLPLVSERVAVEWNTTKRMVNRAVKYTLWASLAMVLVGEIAAPWLYTTLFTGEYIGSILVFRIALLSLLIESLAFIQTPLLFALRSQKSLFYAMLAGMIFNLLFVWPLVALFDVYGAAWIQFLREVILFGFQYYFIKALKSDFAYQWENLWKFDDLDRLLFHKVVGRAKDSILDLRVKLSRS